MWVWRWVERFWDGHVIGEHEDSNLAHIVLEFWQMSFTAGREIFHTRQRMKLGSALFLQALDQRLPE